MLWLILKYLSPRICYQKANAFVILKAKVWDWWHNMNIESGHLCREASQHFVQWSEYSDAIDHLIRNIHSMIFFFKRCLVFSVYAVMNIPLFITLNKEVRRENSYSLSCNFIQFPSTDRFLFLILASDCVFFIRIPHHVVDDVDHKTIIHSILQRMTHKMRHRLFNRIIYIHWWKFQQGSLKNTYLNCGIGTVYTFKTLF